MTEAQIFQDERDRILNQIDEEREAFCKRWLVSRGWDGTEEHARKLSEGWTIRQQFKDGVMTFKMVSLPRIAEDGGQLYYLDNMNKINLTKLFGKGNEPKTVEEFARIYPIAFLDYGSLT